MINNGEKRNKKQREKKKDILWAISKSDWPKGFQWMLAGGQRVVGNCSETSRSLLSIEQTVSIGQDQGSRDRASIYFIEIVRRLVSSKPFPLSVIRGPRRCIVAVVELFLGVEDVVSVVALVDVNLFCEFFTKFF